MPDALAPAAVVDGQRALSKLAATASVRSDAASASPELLPLLCEDDDSDGGGGAQSPEGMHSLPPQQQPQSHHVPPPPPPPPQPPALQHPQPHQQQHHLAHQPHLGLVHERSQSHTRSSTPSAEATGRAHGSLPASGPSPSSLSLRAAHNSPPHTTLQPPTTTTTTATTTSAPPPSSNNMFLQMIVYLWNFRFLPLRARWRANKYKRALLNPSTPLRLRETARHARALKSPAEPRPWLFVARLLWPFPSWRLAAELPATPRAIVARPQAVGARARDLMFLRSMPLWRARDTPQRALYRLYEAMCANNGPMIKDEVDYFWSRAEPRWATSRIEDPGCGGDPERYAVLAAVVEELVEAFMGRLEMGRRRSDKPIRNLNREPAPLVAETAPAWTAAVGPLATPLVLHAGEDRMLDGPFFARNVWANSGYFYTT